MSSTTLRLSSPDLLAEYVRESELRSFFEKRLAAPPDHMAILIRNGQIIETFKGAHFSVGGLVSKLREAFVGSSHISILLADLKPFSIQTSFKGISKDQVVVAARATFELQINPDRPVNAMGLVNASGYLTREEVLARIQPHLSDRVVEAAVQRLNSDALRGDRGMQDLVQAEIMREVERVVGDLGMIVRAVSLEWALNDTERANLQRSELEREQRKLDEQLGYIKREMQRTADARAYEIKFEVDEAKLKSLSEEELEHLALNREIRILDTRVEAQRRQELEALQHEITVLRNERVGKFENRLAEASHLMDAAKLQKSLKGIHLEIDALEQSHQVEMEKLRAFSKLEIDVQTSEAARIQKSKEERLKLEISKEAQNQQLDHIRPLVDIETINLDHDSNRKIREKQFNAQTETERIRAESAMRVAQMEAANKLSAEQILAVNAGLSSDVANVLVEQARANANGHEQVMSVMREMVARATEARVASESQARDMFHSAMEGVTGVAQGVRVNQSGGVAIDETASTECPKCGRTNTSKSRFCIGCGHQLRT